MAGLVRFFGAPACDIYGRLQPSALGQRILSGIAWSLLGVAVARFLGVGTSILIARLLGKVSFGEFGMIQNTMAMFGFLAGMGLATTVTKYVAEYRSTDRERVGRIIALSGVLSWAAGGVMTIAVFAAVPWLARYSLHAPHLVPQLRVSAVLLLLAAVTGAQTGVLAGFEAFRSTAKVSVWAGILGVPLMMSTCFFWGLTGAIWGLALSSAVNCFLNHVLIRREMRRNGVPVLRRGMLAEIEILWNFSVPVTLIAFIFAPANWLSSVFVAATPHGYAALGSLSAAFQWRNAVVLIPGVLVGVALPTLSNLHGLGEQRKYKRMLAVHLSTTTGVAAVACAFIALFAKVIAHGYGADFLDCVPVIRWMALAGFLMAISSAAGAAISSIGRAWSNFYCALGAGAILIGAAYMLTPRYGALGVAIANVVAYFVQSAGQLGLTWANMKRERESQ